MPMVAVRRFAPDPSVRAMDDDPPPVRELPPLVKRILAEYSATGMPPAYLPAATADPKGGDA